MTAVPRSRGDCWIVPGTVVSLVWIGLLILYYGWGNSTTLAVMGFFLLGAVLIVQEVRAHGAERPYVYYYPSALVLVAALAAMVPHGPAWLFVVAIALIAFMGHDAASRAAASGRTSCGDAARVSLAASQAAQIRRNALGDAGPAWAVRDLIHSYGERHPSVSDTAVGHDIATLGAAIPSLAGIEASYDRGQLHAVLQRYDERASLTLTTAIALADCLMNPDAAAPPTQPTMRLPILHDAVWAISDLIHYYGVDHPSVSGSQIGADIAALGEAIPALAGLPTPYDKRQLLAVFQRYGWADVPVTIEAAVDLADCRDREAFLAIRRDRRLQLSAKGSREEGVRP